MFDWIYTIIVIENVLCVGLTIFIIVLLRKASPSLSNFRMYSVIQLIAAICKTLSYAMNWVVNKEWGSGWIKSGNLLYGDFMCSVQGILLTFFTFSQELWIVTIFINCHYIVKHHEDSYSKVQEGEKALLPYFVAVNIILPLIIVLLFGIFGQYGRSSLYCWLKRYTMDDQFYIVVINYSLKGLIILINIGFLWSIHTTIKTFFISSKNEEIQKTGKSIQKRIFLYIAIQLIGGAIQTITRLSPLDELMIPGVILNASQGFCFGICVFINENGMELLRKKNGSKETEDNYGVSLADDVDDNDELIE